MALRPVAHLWLMTRNRTNCLLSFFGMAGFLFFGQIDAGTGLLIY